MLREYRDPWGGAIARRRPGLRRGWPPAQRTDSSRARPDPAAPSAATDPRRTS